MIKILIIEEDINIRNIIGYNLRAEGYEVIEVDNGVKGLELALDNSISMVIADIKIKDLGGVNCILKIREQSNKPILIVSAIDDEINKVNCLNAGADDYIVKPFSLKELVARVNANLRKKDINCTNNIIKLSKNIILDKGNKNIEVNGKIRDLSITEYNLLEYLSNNPNSVFSRQSLLSKVWGYEYGDSRTVDVAICRLREKLEKNPNRPEIIKTRRGLGYYYAVAN